ncbi:tRNA-uridine aminocarboxypropyltransferase 2 isoform X2 [Bacillus rossius redtenbacheri]|uniref:tRNA-uridine aminocarboxypropyltransferase 2 isoform X2 n=1 Tax=Bacillus rossius redtenbacheri TaxID=93214 RepID=UPI002FDC99B5
MNIEFEAWDDLSCLPLDPPKMRDVCYRCRRPNVVCWCPFLPAVPVQTRCTVVLLQHPAEQRRRLRTAPMLAQALAPGRCLVFRGKKFNLSRHEQLREILASPHALLVYPSACARDVRELASVSERRAPYTLVLLDGTWPQAKAMFHGTPQLQLLPQVKLVDGETSEYVIRSQPTDGCLSTLETAAQALSILEGDPALKDVLVQPLRALCSFQLEHGAVTHQSTEFRVRNNTYPRQIGRRLSRLLHGSAS